MRQTDFLEELAKVALTAEVLGDEDALKSYKGALGPTKEFTTGYRVILQCESLGGIIHLVFVNVKHDKIRAHSFYNCTLKQKQGLVNFYEQL